ncbi:MAG: IS21-like element helper ATPase IstB [Clostridia bacterium]|nr:IS21-like element helper ATPase IstB [Clostridia bacterium]
MTDYEQLISNLKELKLDNLSENYPNYSTEVDQKHMTFTEALIKLTEGEIEYRHNKAIQRRIKQARFPVVKRLDEFDFNFQPTINKQAILGLKSLGFLSNQENILLIGSPGVGKTHIAISLGVIACENGFKTLFINCHDLLLSLRNSNAKGTLERQMKRYANYDLLIIDEIGYLPMEAEDANLLFQLVNSRYEQHSTIVTTNVPLSGWGKILHNPSAAETILDRLVYKSHIFKISGKSYRFKSAANHKLP